MTPRLAIVCTHPIQYYAPVFRLLACRDDLKVRVFYGWQGNTSGSIDRGFGQSIQWDIPLLEGYDFDFVDNVSADPGTHHYRGIDLPALEQQIQEWRASAVLVYGWRFKAHLSLMRSVKGRLPVFFRGDSTLLDDRPGIRCMMRRAALHWVYRYVDFAFYVGTNNYHYFRKHGLREHQLRFAPHAVDNHRFGAFDPVTSNSLRCQLGIEEEEVMLLFAGKMDSNKAPDQLFRAFIHAAVPGTHLVFAGSGELEDQLRAERAKNVHFLGFQNQSKMPHVYGASDVLALPSHSETWGLALNEAMAAGCAVLASDHVGAAADLIEVGLNGWISKADDQDSLNQQVFDACQQGRARLTQMGREAQRMIQSWSIEAQAEAIGSSVCRLLK